VYTDGFLIWITEEVVHGRYVVCVFCLITVSVTQNIHHKMTGLLAYMELIKILNQHLYGLRKTTRASDSIASTQANI